MAPPIEQSRHIGFDLTKRRFLLLARCDRKKTRFMDARMLIDPFFSSKDVIISSFSFSLFCPLPDSLGPETVRGEGFFTVSSCSMASINPSALYRGADLATENSGNVPIVK